MANTTTTYWDVDGVSLQTYAMNITTLGGPRAGVPPWRGENFGAAYRRGATWRQKVPDQRVLSLAMWARGTDSDGAIPGMGAKAKMTDNLRTLQSLFWKDYSRQVTLTKRWLHTDGSTVKSASALVELTNTMEPTMKGPYAAGIVVDLLMADPFFYGPEVTQSIPKQTTPWTSWVAEGDAITNRVNLEFNGNLVNPTLTLSDPTPDIFVTVGGTIAGGDKVTLDCDLYTATRTSDSANLIGAVSYSGSRQWMVVLPGTNTMQLIATSGTGTCSVKYRPAYF